MDPVQYNSVRRITSSKHIATKNSTLKSDLNLTRNSMKMSPCLQQVRSLLIPSVLYYRREEESFSLHTTSWNCFTHLANEACPRETFQLYFYAKTESDGNFSAVVDFTRQGRVVLLFDFNLIFNLRCDGT
jgi:hypothetical protein